MLWHELWGRADAPPPILWVEGVGLDCDEGRKFVARDGHCAEGESIETPTAAGSVWQVKIALPDRASPLPPSETALAHELRHVHLGWLATAGHPVEEFGEDGFGGHVGEDMAQLAAAGL